MISRHMRTLLVAALVFTLLPVMPAAAEPETTSTPVPTPPVAPAPEPATTPTQGPQRPGPATTPSTVAPDRLPADDTAIDVPIDEETEEFRERLAEQQARLDEFMAQLDALDRELAIAAEEFNAASERLNATRQRVSVAELDLTKAREAFDLQSELLGTRASAMYRSGTFAAVEMLLSSKSLSDFLARAKFLNTIGLADADLTQALRSQKEYLEQAALDLKNAELLAESLEFELKVRQIEVMLRIQERQQLLAEAQADLLEMLDEEAGRRAREEAALLREILSGANRAGIAVEPGSVVETAFGYHGIPYLWGGKNPSGFDCSGLVLYVFRQHGVNLPHYSGAQFQVGQKIAPAALQPGDAVFFGSPVYHVGIYVGGGYFIHAPRTGDFVKISRLAERRDYSGARRYDWKPRVGPIQNAVVQPSMILGPTIP